jgi:hypothetical protein
VRLSTEQFVLQTLLAPLALVLMLPALMLLLPMQLPVVYQSLMHLQQAPCIQSL